MSGLKVEITKFTIVGIGNTIVTFIVYYALLRLLGLNYLVALTISWAVGILVSYVFNFMWVFKPETRLLFRSRFIKYMISYMASYAINITLLSLIVVGAEADPLFAQFFLIPVIVIFNFTTSKYWSLRQYSS